MERNRIWIVTLLALAGVAVAAWQYQRYLHERDLIQETLQQQAHSVTNALVGGMRSHRRMGSFFQEQLQRMLAELVKSQDVLAVAVTTPGGQPLEAAGRSMLLDLAASRQPGDVWLPVGLQSSQPVVLVQEALPGGQGRGQGLRWRELNEESEGPFAGGGSFTSVLLLDRTRADTLLRRAAWSHTLVAAALALLVVCVALAWRASVRLVAANGHARLLETEARHLRELGQAAAGLAHETRNPLGLIRGWAQRLIQPADADPQQLKHAHAVIEECDRVTARINAFLAFARPRDPDLQDVELASLVEELATILQPDLEVKELTVRRPGELAGRVVRADRELLRQALFNMLLNAIHFSPRGAAVRVELRAGGDGTCRIEVADRGPGVPPDQADSLFTPYFTSRTNGTGLGLATVRRIAFAHGWHAGYCPQGGGGSIFYLAGIHG